jgi:hypothetical protein
MDAEESRRRKSFSENNLNCLETNIAPGFIKKENTNVSA